MLKTLSRTETLYQHDHYFEIVRQKRKFLMINLPISYATVNTVLKISKSFETFGPMKFFLLLFMFNMKACDYILDLFMLHHLTFR